VEPVRSISVGELTATVQAAVKKAMQTYPNFAGPIPAQIEVIYWIQGYPAPPFYDKFTVAELQKFTDEVASQIVASASPALSESLRALVESPQKPSGSIGSFGGHLVIGIPFVDPRPQPRALLP
jgi:hypothetical protein